MHALISLAIRAHQLPTACWDHVGRGEDKADRPWLYGLSSFTGRWPIPYSQVQNHDLGFLPHFGATAMIWASGLAPSGGSLRRP